MAGSTTGPGAGAGICVVSPPDTIRVIASDPSGGPDDHRAQLAIAVEAVGALEDLEEVAPVIERHRAREVSVVPGQPRVEIHEEAPSGIAGGDDDVAKLRRGALAIDANGAGAGPVLRAREHRAVGRRRHGQWRKRDLDRS